MEGKKKIKKIKLTFVRIIKSLYFAFAFDVLKVNRLLAHNKSRRFPDGIFLLKNLGGKKQPLSLQPLKGNKGSLAQLV